MFSKMLQSWPVVIASAVGASLGVLVIGKDYVAGPAYAGQERLEGSTVIVTGASGGIGKEIAREMAKRGASVIMACRDVAKADAAYQDIVKSTGNKDVSVHYLDLSSIESIIDFTDGVEPDRHVKILVNNAGVMRTPAINSEDGFELQLAVNHLGPFLLTNLLLPRLENSAPSRVVNLSTTNLRAGHLQFDDLNSSRGYDAAAAHYQSKLASLMCSLELARRLREKGSRVTVNSVNPGVAFTDITRHYPSARSMTRFTTSPIVWATSSSASQAARGVVHAALSPELDGVSGVVFKARVQVSPPLQALDEEDMKRIWAISHSWTQQLADRARAKKTS